jgi:hypothetical protein
MITATIESPAVEKRLYKSTLKFNSVVFPNGHVAHFKGGMFITSDADQIAYLDAQISKNGFGGVIFIDPNARTLTAEQENPMLALRKKFYEEFQAEKLAQSNPMNDLGTSDQGKLKPASTTDIAPVALGGDGAASVRAAVAARASK